MKGQRIFWRVTNLACMILQKKDTYGAWEYYLGLEHTDSAPKRAHQTNQVFIHIRYFGLKICTMELLMAIV